MPVVTDTGDEAPEGVAFPRRTQEVQHPLVRISLCHSVKVRLAHVRGPADPAGVTHRGTEHLVDTHLPTHEKPNTKLAEDIVPRGREARTPPQEPADRSGPAVRCGIGKLPEYAPKVLIWLETHTKPDIGAGKRPSKVSEGDIWQRPGKTEINLLCLVQAHGRHRSTIPEEGGPFVREEHVVTRLHKTHRAAQSRCRKLCPHAGKRAAEPTEVDEGPLLSDGEPERATWTLPRSIATQVDGTPLSCGITIRRPYGNIADQHAAIFYLHGGGLLYGTRDDLPLPYVRLMCRKGFSLICMDYPLAPQVDIEGIVGAVIAAWRHCEQEVFGGLGVTKAFLCGRSAGAYLALLLASRLQHEDERGDPAIKTQGTPDIDAKDDLVAGPSPTSHVHVLGVMDFYGYCDLSGTMQRALWQPSMHYRRSMPAITPRLARQLMGAKVLTSASLEDRFLLYAYARQTGRWGELVGVTRENAAAWSLSEKDQSTLPPLFIAASRDDADVPFACSERLSRMASNATTFFVDGLGHDFDRDLSHYEGINAWDSCLSWAIEQVGASGGRRQVPTGP